MQTELVGTDELNRVKNYLSAGIARKFDGIFAAASAFKNLLLSGLDYSYYENFFETIKNIQSEDIRNIAQTYFNADQFLTVIVGKEKP